jgi:drug/metabolite transporter (DMT)-like permease
VEFLREALSLAALRADLLARIDHSMSPRSATLIGLIAILMWSLLAVATVSTGKTPAFQLAAMTFAIGALIGSFTWIGRRQAIHSMRQPLLVWLIGVGGLFGYHALYFLALRFAPPAEAGLLNYLWPLLIVLFSSFLPGERLALHHIIGALSGLAGTVLLFVGNEHGAFEPGQVPGLIAAFVAAFVWAGYSVMSRRFKAVPTDAVAGFCSVTALLAAIVHAFAEDTVWPERTLQWVALIGLGIWTGRCRFLCLGRGREARRYPRAGSCFVCNSLAFDRVSHGRGICETERQHCHRGAAHRRRRAHRREGYDLEKNLTIFRRASNEVTCVVQVSR